MAENHLVLCVLLTTPCIICIMIQAETNMDANHHIYFEQRFIGSMQFWYVHVRHNACKKCQNTYFPSYWCLHAHANIL